jgi:hypothetical protein
MLDPKLKTIVDRQLPEFVREDYPRFNAFVKAYFAYLDLTDERNLEELRDIDKTVYEYIIYINNEIGFSNSPNATIDNIDPRLFLRKSKSLFKSKGTEEAYRFLFKILFNKTVDISYPWDIVLKSSDGVWKQDTSIFVNVTSGNISSVLGNEIIIQTSGRQVKVSCERYELVRDNIYEVFIDKNFYGNIGINNTVTAGTMVGVTLSTTADYTILIPGKGYKVGDFIEGTVQVGDVTIRQLLKVTKVDGSEKKDNKGDGVIGGVEKFSIVKYGCGYLSDFILNASKSSLNLPNSKVELSKNSFPVLSYADDNYIGKYTESGAVSYPNYWDPVYSDPTYAGEIINLFSQTTANANFTSDEPNYVFIKFDLGAVTKYQGYYVSNSGFLDDAIKLQDSKYYQKYSYLLSSDQSLESYDSYIKSSVHPAGTAMFGEYQITNEYNPQISAELIIDEYISMATFRTINKDIDNEYVSMSDRGGARLNSYDLDFVEPTHNPSVASTRIF